VLLLRLSQGLLSALLLSSFPVVRSSGEEDGVAEHLRALADPSGEVRAAAERWLSARVEPSDAALVSDALLRGDAEVDRRLAHVLARSPRGLDLAAILRERADASVGSVVEEAVRERWARTGALEFPALHGGDLVALALELWASFGATQTIRLELGGTLGESAALLEREGRMFLGLSVEPALRLRHPRVDAPRVLEGPWNRVCLELAGAYGVEPELHGLPLEASREAPSSPAFLAFTAGSCGARSDERILSWFRAVVLETDSGERAAAALALVSSGWSDGLQWLERRFLEGGDGAVLEALLHAATTGRVVQALVDPARVRALVALAEREAAKSPPDPGHFELVLRALCALPPQGLRGASLVDPVLEGWREASARGRWIRLVVLEGMASARGADPAREVLLAPDAERPVPTGLVLQALRTWAASGAGAAAGVRVDFAPAALARALAASANPEQAAELGRTLAQGGFALPDEGAAPSGLAAITLLAWALELGEDGRAGRIWHAASASGGSDPERSIAALARGLARASRTGLSSRFVAAWTAARGEAERRGAAATSLESDVASIDRAAIRSGGLPGAKVLEIWEAWAKESRLPEQDLDLLAVVAGLGAHPAAKQARATLVGGLGRVLEGNGSVEEVRPHLPALERAQDELLANGFDAVAEEFRREIERLRTDHRRSKAVEALFSSGWPPAPRLAQIDLGARTRRLSLPDLGADEPR